MNIKLLPCPFCGGEVRLMNIDDYGQEVCINYEDELDVDCSFIHCYNCDMDFMPHTETAREVLEAWNTRKPMERIVEQLEKEIELAEKDQERCVMKALPYFDTAKGYATGINNALEIVKGGVDNETN